MKLKIMAMFLAAGLAFAITSCGFQEEAAQPSERPAFENAATSQPTASMEGESAPTPVEEEKVGEVYGAFTYPQNPPEELREALLRDSTERGLALEIGGVERIEFSKKECAQITINFGADSDNLCVINFTNKHLDYGYDESFNGNDNPSFTLLFKDPENARDMVTLLTSVIKYLSPELSLAEAERLANNQDKTLGTDGYSQPKDIGGYQIQARYTNPRVFAQTPLFDACLGVTVRAIGQMWHGAINTADCLELKTFGNLSYLSHEYPYWDKETDEPKIVYLDCVIKDVQERQSYIHGETWKVITAETFEGKELPFLLDTWEFLNPYEFGVGQRYTIFVRRDYRVGIIQAVQRTESTEINKRGQLAPSEYATTDDLSLRIRTEPQTDGAVYDVRFEFTDRTASENLAAAEGQGLGFEQFFLDPVRDDYTFEGWFDNTDWSGEPYTKDTPIYADTYLYAKWRYTGIGGAWPRAYRGTVHALKEGGAFTVTADGYNMNLETPSDQRFRWQPVSWRLSGGDSGNFPATAPYEAVITMGDNEQTLFITYREEIFDGIDWQKTGQIREVPETSLTSGDGS